MIAIRTARPSDAEAIAAIYAPHVLGGIASFEHEAPDADAMRERMAASDGFYPWIVATGGHDAGVLGYAQGGRFKERAAYAWTVETTIYLAAAERGRGTGRLLYERLIDTLRAQGFVQAVGLIALPNPASIALHEAVGFRSAGTFGEVGYKRGRWVDVGIWQCRLNPSATPPVEPGAFARTGLVRG